MILDHLSCSPGPRPCPVSLALAWAGQAKQVPQGLAWGAQGPVMVSSTDDLCMPPAMPAPPPSPVSTAASAGVPIAGVQILSARLFVQGNGNKKCF